MYTCRPLLAEKSAIIKLKCFDFKEKECSAIWIFKRRRSKQWVPIHALLLLSWLIIITQASFQWCINKKNLQTKRLQVYNVILKGLEPLTSAAVTQCSIQLSYRTILCCFVNHCSQMRCKERSFIIKTQILFCHTYCCLLTCLCLLLIKACKWMAWMFWKKRKN